jgi:hypothetical protein
MAGDDDYGRGSGGQRLSWRGLLRWSLSHIDASPLMITIR